MSNRNWYIANRGIKLHIDGAVPWHHKEIAMDVETYRDGRVYSVALCGDLQTVYAYFNITDELTNYLRTVKFVGHNVKSDIGWMSSFGLSMDQVAYDTMLGAYTIQSTRLRFGLKELAEEDLGLKWPKLFKENGTITDDIIELACVIDKSLLISHTKVYKTKPSVTTMKVPKVLTIEKLPKEIVANYNGMDAYATYYLKVFQSSKATVLSRKFLDKIEMPTARVLYDVERKGIKVNPSKLIEIHKKFYRQAVSSKKSFFKQIGKEILLTSHVQVKKALNENGIPCAATNEDVLLPFKNHPIVKALLDFRHCAKICSTYTKPLYKAAKASPDGRVHCNFMQHTDTGRLACRKPNLQNQPPELREAFIAEEGSVYVNADYSQIELRVSAHFSEEPLMLDTFINNKRKFHDVTAEQINRPYKVGKTVNFLLTNSGGPGRLAEVAEIPYDDAELVMKTFWEKFHVLRDSIEKEKKIAVANGGIYTLFGRWVPIPALRSSYIGMREAAKRQAMSVKIQGSAADLMKIAMIKLARKHKLTPVITVHDELMFEVKKEDAENVAEIVKQEMEAVATLKVPLVADVGIGNTWAEAKAG